MARSPQEQHIAQIKEEFGIKDRRSESLHKAIEQLSEGLYSKDIHFVLELIQNAEDNHYAAKVNPDLEFLLLSHDPTETEDAEGALLIINNEYGFQPDNVNEICAIGGSKKTKKEGYIGEKGIGFKSVFLVSKRPHIGFLFHLWKIIDNRMCSSTMIKI